ncbi:MAG: HAMP domain-containing histidine kinase [Rhodospirillaceae bacterium]|nr:MAG: HAMP domain-containing histidine kinase [Rhodospirillaceae bacterium]
MARWHSLWLTPVLAPEIEQELNIERLMSVARQQPIAATAHAGVSLALAAAVEAPVGPWGLLALGGFQIMAALQLKVWLQHRRKPRPLQVSDATIGRIILWTAVLGLMWGVFTAHLLTVSSHRDCALLGVVIVGMAASGSTMLTAIPAAGMIFVAFVIAPIVTVSIVMGLHADIMGTRSDIVFGMFLAATGVFIAIAGCYNYLGFLNILRLRLRMAQLAEEAGAAIQAKTRFLANMGHELRTPLNAIIGFGEMISGEMKGTIGNRDYVEFADAIVHSAQNLTSVIDDIFDLSRIHSSSDKPSDSDVAVATLIDHALVTMRPQFMKANIGLETNIEPNLPVVRVNANRIHQVLIGLLSNAIKFSGLNGKVSLEACFVRDDYNVGPSQIMFRVTDHGPGIPPAELREILRPFVWTREAEHNQVPGTGLKLPLADQIIRAHGGTLHIASIEGQGTVVTVTLPPERIVGYQSPGVVGSRGITAAGAAHQE